MLRTSGKAHPLKNPLDEAQLFQRRAVVAVAVVGVLLAALAGYFFYLQVVRHEDFAARSDRNRMSVRVLPPSRGLIFDRNGVLLADNRLAYRLELVPEKVVDLADTLARLQQMIGLDEDALRRFEQERRSHRAFERVPVKLRLSETEVSRFAVVRFQFPGVDVVPYLTRHYPEGELLGQVVGYVGRIDSADLEQLNPREYAGTTHTGKTGIEAYYESDLHGRVGLEQVETNAQGRVLRVLERVPATPGQDLYLSIDSRLQRAAVEAFEGKPGAAVAIDPRNGEVLAMVTLPTFDANLFVSGIRHADYQALLASPRRPLFNRALQGGFAPGSTLKPFVGLAGLRLGLRRATDRVLSTGVFQLPGQSQVWRDWQAGGHGWVNLHEALAQSVNTYFYQLALEMGIDRMAAELGQFGFGERTGIDLRGENRGNLPTREWKLQTHKLPWYPGETVIAGIGQGFHVTTPLQLAAATAQLAMAGKRFRPRLLRARKGEFDAEPLLQPAELAAVLELAPEHVAAVREGMVAVLHGPTGTARALGQGMAYQIAGKTGTAQTHGQARDKRVYDESRLAENLRHQALFVGFAPAEQPTIALAVVVEHGGSGSRAAAPVARRIFDAWLRPEQPPTPVDERELIDTSPPQDALPDGDAPAPPPVPGVSHG